MSSGASAIREAAPAKINLFLHIVGRRPDGMHLIDSLVVFAELGDVVTVSPGNDISLTRAGPMAGDLPPVADDLVFRAATLLAQAAGVAAALCCKREVTPRELDVKELQQKLTEMGVALFDSNP